ncbi:hypothetical protein GCM10011490_03190 [Pseudoclavibacter endophyticus]|uniref:TetR family transcriptional regulator n=1 Tax=Pseudoclavibacter endophyticus TaxID=1778590 RepID=A0A6H9WLX1_9MICO|nr:TetR family transcriptional regulator [Pseudoclavibacter endophyticus]KAB1650153.1 TetR family transcriptional regulator [Pseudoclavibacter endophyticus]GGA56702.1 hypothetical protein GCM10011490_03190 [Pseudoclavibacter endophyticus]
MPTRSARTPHSETRRSRVDVVTVAERLLDEGGLAGLTMRNLATTLGVQPSALYWHFPNKQAILAAVADSILERAEPPDRSVAAAASGQPRRERAETAALTLREALLATTDGAEVVASTLALDLGDRRPDDAIRAALVNGGRATERDAIAARTITTYLLGHTQHWQQRRFAERLELIERSPADERAEFLEGLRLLLDGALAHDAEPNPPAVD